MFSKFTRISPRWFRHRLTGIERALTHHDPTFVARWEAFATQGGFPATGAMCARLSPIAYEHINFLGRHAFTRAGTAAGLRPFHDPAHA
ncbi:hypothetical protein [Actinomadura sp. 6N118]|uniref:hypothetical protein n=1 Tax=Actinomadura sp. 6N118 TaxID=3375151 RepID=UPI0037B53FA2